MKAVFLAGISMLFVSGAALADENKLFNSLDTNGDGLIAMEEAKGSQTISAYFVLFDTDGNGTIDANELNKVAGSPPSSSSSANQLTRL